MGNNHSPSSTLHRWRITVNHVLDEAVPFQIWCATPWVLGHHGGGGQEAVKLLKQLEIMRNSAVVRARAARRSV